MIDKLMLLLVGCDDFCDTCSIFRNSTTCLKCGTNKIIANGIC